MFFTYCLSKELNKEEYTVFKGWSRLLVLIDFCLCSGGVHTHMQPLVLLPVQQLRVEAGAHGQLLALDGVNHAVSGQLLKQQLGHGHHRHLLLPQNELQHMSAIHGLWAVTVGHSHIHPVLRAWHQEAALPRQAVEVPLLGQ